MEEVIIQDLDNDLNKFLENKNLIVASNRGPIEFYRGSDEKIEMKTGAGGMIPTLLPIIEKTKGTWVASAMNDVDIEMAEKYSQNRISVPENNPKFYVSLIIHDLKTYNEFYNMINNPLIWFIHHYMWNLPSTPKIDQDVHNAWKSYENVNQKFAEKIIDEINSCEKEPLLMLHDIHLELCPTYIRKQFENIFLYQFIHIPWPQPDYFEIFPNYIQKAMIEGLLSNDLIGFHIKKYVKNFLMTSESYADHVDWDNNIIHYNGRKIYVRNYPISVDDKKLQKFSMSEEVLKYEEYVKKIKGNNFLFYRTERTDPSKNIIRGFEAYDTFLEKYPEFQGKVTFFITGVATRENVKEYQDYKVKVNQIINDINKKYSKNDWKPIVPHFDAEYSLVTAAFKNYDCLLVNSIHDGMNIVPKEGSIVNENNGILILSETTGAYNELKDYSININAFDTKNTVDAMYKAVRMDHEERKKRLSGLKKIISNYNVYSWMSGQFRDIQKLF